MSFRRRFSFTLLISIALSFIALLAVACILILFISESSGVLKSEGTRFITGKNWYYRQLEFGSAPMIYGTLAVALVAMVLAAPIGLGAAIFGSCFLPARLRMLFKVSIELLAGVPSVVYGLLGILLLRNWVYEALEKFDLLSGDCLLTGGILLAVMILPTLITLADDALHQTPLSKILGARALGLNQTESILLVTLPHSWKGLVSALLLALGRACGEMIAVFLVVGRQDNQWPESVLAIRPLMDAGQTLSTKLGSSEINIAYGNPAHWSAMVGVGMLLLAIVTFLTVAGSKIGSFRRGKA